MATKPATKPQFTLPPGYVAWCHICSEPAFNKITKVKYADITDPTGMTMVEVNVPGTGYKTWAEYRIHAMTHRQYKG